MRKSMNPTINYTSPKRLLNPASGYLTGYSHTLNPYAGCAFACSYCYVRQMPVALFREETWGTWVDVKQDAAELLSKEIRNARKKGAVTIFMSSATDPYQPAEFRERVTRRLLEAMIIEPPDFLFVQTRSPLVVRDIDILKQLQCGLRISVTVETDLESIRKAFTPSAPPIQARLLALQKLASAGLPVQATVAPVLPCSAGFAAKLAVAAPRVCVDDFYMGDGSQGRRTAKLGIQDIFGNLKLTEWHTKDAYLKVVEMLKEHFAPEQIFISQQGFLP